MLQTVQWNRCYGSKTVNPILVFGQRHVLIAVTHLISSHSVLCYSLPVLTLTSKRTNSAITSTARLFICGDPAHFKISCPQWLRNNPTAAVASNASHGPNNTQQKRSYGSTGKDDNSNVYINATIEGIPVTCLLDSGCEQSLMPLQLIKLCGYAIQPTD